MQNFTIFLLSIEKYYPELEGLSERFENRGINFADKNFLIRDFKKKYCIDEILQMAIEKDDKELIRNIRWLIFEHLISVGQNCNLYENIRKYLIDNKNNNIYNIISFNFDCYINGQLCDKHYFDYNVSFNELSSYKDLKYSQDNKICDLIKPHGSLDWRICPKCGKTYIRFYEFARTIEQEYCLNDCCKEKLEPLILLPFESGKEIFNRLIDISKIKIGEAELIYIVGYSFPEYDKDIKELFKKNVNKNAELIIIDNIVDSEMASRKKKIEEIFIDNKIEFYWDGFKKWLNQFIGKEKK